MLTPMLTSATMRPMQTTLGDNETLDSTASMDGDAAQGAMRVVVVHHPDAHRVGDSIQWAAGVLAVGRSAPTFGQAPLGVRHISRAPVTFEVTPNAALIIDPSGTRTPLRVNGEPLIEVRRFSPETLRNGLSITLARRVVLWVRWTVIAPGPDVPGLIGQSDAIEQLRHEIGRVAAFDVPCLIVGETGVGKERVAQGIHALSARRREQFVALNMAALAPSVAPSQLFGHAKGAFTGADHAAPGAFVTAHRGTVFLDEIGACPSAVQAQLLRVLESRTVVPVGRATPRQVDVRVLAATDAHLESEVESGRFRAPLLHRLSGYVLQVPPVSARRGDVPLLFHHFLHAILQQTGEAERLHQTDRPWIPTALIEKLLHADWAGNVRAIRNAAQTLAVRIGGREKVSADLLADRLNSPPAEPKRSRHRAAADVSEDELLTALKANRYRIAPTAETLNVARTTLYALIGLSSQVRTAASLSAQEITAARSDHAALPDAAQALGVSTHALKLRMRALGLS